MLSHEPECDAETLAPALPDTLIGEAIALLKDAERAGLRLATAESCTGGLLSSLLTDVEGTSHVFDRGFVTYSKRSKCDLLGVPAEMIRLHGAVSEEVARAMAWGALRRSDATIAFAITGFTGRGGPTEEAGLVHVACATEGGYSDHKQYRFGDIGRGATRLAALQAAIHHLRVAVRHLDLRPKLHPAGAV
ncbi:MAG TPA: CinA family protein [Sphingopyxis sp.]|nr:CinA family protein [Sphingopyxis sp.]